jgi:hypothetical protein
MRKQFKQQPIERIRQDLLFMECNKRSNLSILSRNKLDLMIEKCRKRKNVDCNYFLQKKIRMNMRERKEKGWSVPQSVAISYSQVKKLYPSCQFKKRSSKKVVRIPVKKGGLRGYTLKLGLVDRRKKLDQLVRIYGWGNIVKKLNVLYIYNKNNYPSNALKFRRDMKYIQKKFKEIFKL